MHVNIQKLENILVQADSRCLFKYYLSGFAYVLLGWICLQKTCCTPHKNMVCRLCGISSGLEEAMAVRRPYHRTHPCGLDYGSRYALRGQAC